MSTDKDWEKWGQDNPYYGVLSADRFKGRKLDATSEEEFYSLGIYDIDAVMGHIQALEGSKPRFAHAVDFGCGVGRLTQPLTRHAEKVTGLDVSPSMISAARDNTSKKYKSKIEYKVSDDTLSALPTAYDFVHSYIVLQHIPVKRGEKIIRKLLENLQNGGYAALHITFRHDTSPTRRLLIKARERLPLAHKLANIINRKPADTPLMRMHTYDLSNIYTLFSESGISTFNVVVTKHGEYDGAMIVGKKQP